jgi:hypothetical protein
VSENFDAFRSFDPFPSQEVKSKNSGSNRSSFQRTTQKSMLSIKGSSQDLQRYSHGKIDSIVAVLCQGTVMKFENFHSNAPSQSALH